MKLTAEQIIEIVKAERDYYGNARKATYESEDYYERMDAKFDALDDLLAKLQYYDKV